VGPHDRFEREICTKEREILFLVQRRERGSKRVYLGADEKEVYLTIKATTDGTSIFCRKERMV